jgi:competence ComEA-like helix-hairpin-helix protein
VNINTATQAELETLPGVGEKTAEKIMRFRETQPFTQVDDLQYVQGIGEKRMEALRPNVTVE